MSSRKSPSRRGRTAGSGRQSRSYGQFCPLARSLDLVGERWTLLIVRNLAVGPQRYTDLLEDLPGIGTNLLAERLRSLEGADIVRRRSVEVPRRALQSQATVAVYELTDRGEALVDSLLPLVRWGFPTLRKRGKGAVFRPAWAVWGFRAVFRSEAAAGVEETYELRVDDEIFQLHVEDQMVSVGVGVSHEPDLVLTMDSSTFMAITAGTLGPLEAAAGEGVTVEGSAESLGRFLEIFPLPNSAVA